MANLPTSRSRSCSWAAATQDKPGPRSTAPHTPRGRGSRIQGHPSLPASGSEHGPKSQGFWTPGPILYLTFLYNVILSVAGFYFFIFWAYHRARLPRPGLNKARFFYSVVLPVACQLGWGQGTPRAVLLPLAEPRRGSHYLGRSLDQARCADPEGFPGGWALCVGRGSPCGRDTCSSPLASAQPPGPSLPRSLPPAPIPSPEPSGYLCTLSCPLWSNTSQKGQGLVPGPGLWVPGQLSRSLAMPHGASPAAPWGLGFPGVKWECSPTWHAPGCGEPGRSSYRDRHWMSCKGLGHPRSL